jgi:hypothetical protein
MEDGVEGTHGRSGEARREETREATVLKGKGRSKVRRSKWHRREDSLFLHNEERRCHSKPLSTYMSLMTSAGCLDFSNHATADNAGRCCYFDPPSQLFPRSSSFVTTCSMRLVILFSRSSVSRFSSLKTENLVTHVCSSFWRKRSLLSR